MLYSIGEKFSTLNLTNEAERLQFSENLKLIYSEYMKKWDSYEQSFPLSSLT